MLSVKLYNQKGEIIGEKELPSALFGLKVKPEVVQPVVVAMQANARLAVSHGKSRGEVRGGGRKPWRQKGTGRARHGSIRSPLWRGGGIIFGPNQPRNFKKKINKKVKRQALLMSLADKAAQQKVVLLQQCRLESAKTKKLKEILEKLPLDKSSVLVVEPENKAVLLAARNLPRLATLTANNLNLLKILKGESLVLTLTALEVMQKVYSPKS